MKAQAACCLGSSGDQCKMIQQNFCDADLAMLGSPPSIYEAYRLAIRREYDWVSVPTTALVEAKC